MAKDKKAKKGDQPEAAKPKKAKDKAKKGKGAKLKIRFTERPHPLEALSKLADHPLVSELLAAGALAAVAAVAEAGSKNADAIKSADSAKKAGKAAAAAIGARLLKEFTAAKDAAPAKPAAKK
ncbi:hypothetical protein [Sphingomonas astaxanthinifaciens]|uniref:Uncharacterized protein n=1 Tax=Sphingomonas astaxanthinifaciens DSM 22298 TaxID=1123267 RepID=A0ABQ5ZAI6_9SPHN|nr:hypothetical protein [Sphingomonas astaxanthinifaciens]GLR48496.1 hypothetical protein GCM10007925_22130 [Sphingomonas astaxanthinifaciens DSM 22298]